MNYDLPQQGVNPFLNIHRAFDFMMNEGVPNSHFAPKEELEKRDLNYFSKNDNFGNRAQTKKYISFLHESGVQTFTLQREAMTTEAGCKIIKDLTNPEREG